MVVAASACESARLLLNSKSPRFPNGLANSSGQVGRNLTDTVGYSLQRLHSGARGLPRHNSRRHRRHARLHAVVAAETRSKDFPRGYHIELGGGFGMPQHRRLPRRSARGTKATANR